MSIAKRNLKQSTSSQRYRWTSHATMKMRRYRLSESGVKRIIRYPERTEEGIAENTIAAMRRSQSKKEEFWTMYALKSGRITVITAWRYPGTSPKRNPIPQEILDEVRSAAFPGMGAWQS